MAAVPPPAVRSSLVSPRRRSRPTPLSPLPASRRPPAFLRKQQWRGKLTYSPALKENSFWRASSLSVRDSEINAAISTLPQCPPPPRSTKHHNPPTPPLRKRPPPKS